MNPWTLLQQALGATLAFFYSLIPNYGIAIILLTVVVSLLLFPLTLKQTRSMKAMQEIQPEVKRLQKELKGDREELNKQLMALYQERGVNPAAGCLPLLLQMPIWFALFRVLQLDVSKDTNGIIPSDSALAGALRAGKTNFLGMDLAISPSTAVTDGLVAALPYLFLVGLVVAFGFYQQYQTTRRRDGDKQASAPAQGMQTAMKVMPLVLGFVSWGFPTGLVLYFAVSSLFRIGQQSVMFALDERDQGRAAAAEVTPPPAPEPKKGPAPNTSKKRKQRRRK